MLTRERLLYLLVMLVMGCLPAAHADESALLNAVEQLSPAESPAEPADTVCEISLVGHSRTKERLVHLLLGIDTGSSPDSVELDQAEARLMATGVFSKVKILDVRRKDGRHLFVVLSELPRLSLGDLGGTLYSRRYGKDDSFWRLWRIGASLRLGNIGGRMESLSMAVNFWEWRSVWLTWKKPLYPSPYSLSVGGGLSSFPLTSRPWRSLSVRTKFSVARALAGGGSVYLGVVPLYNRMVYHGPKDSTSALWEADQSDERFFEVFTGVGATLHKYDRYYPHRKGWYGRWQLGFNQPLASGSASRQYMQLDTDMRLHVPAWPPKTSLAYRGQASLRSSDGGRFHYLTAGSEHTIRGFGSGTLGLTSRANNRVLLTAEYRFPIVATPPLRMPGIVDIVLPTRDVYYRLDGAFFVDYAHLWHDITHPLTGHESGLAVGTGFRIALPPAKRALCADLVPVVIYQGKMISKLTDTRQWGYHLYIDLVF
ncbi:MAG: BamA/TamA family outer membrane protein [Chitinivibrionales bacterium]|nr:BamA/TamA family outer membrane protein [Chitinivibrionales bacterium]